MATISSDQSLWLWRTADGKLVRRARFEYSADTIAFSPDGRFLAAACGDSSIRIWEAKSSQEIARIGDQTSLLDAVFTGDGKHIAVANLDASVRLWLWQPQDLMAQARSRLQRNLTPDEWRRYLPDEPPRSTFSRLP